MRLAPWIAALVLLVLPVGEVAAEPLAKKKLLLIGQGPDGHPPSTHEFLAGLSILEVCLRRLEGIETRLVRADEPWTDGPELLRDADGVVLYLSQGSRWMQADPRRYDALTRLAARGGAITALHWAVGAHDAKYIEGQVKLLGGSRGGPQRKYTVADFDVRLSDPKHPIVAGIKPFRVHDEFYYRLDFVAGDRKVTPLLTSTIDGRDETVAWAWDRADGGRSFGFVGLHFHRNWSLAEYRRLVAQGVAWTLRREVPTGGMNVDVRPEELELKKK